MHTIQLSGPVGSESFSIRQVTDILDGPIKIIIDSPGGCIVSSLAIFHSLREHDGEITTEIYRAGSAAAIPALAGDIRLIDGSGYFFVHGCWGSVVGREADMRQAAAAFRAQNKLYDAVIAGRTGLSIRRVRALTRNETRLGAERAVELGFAHRIIGTVKPCPPSPSSPLERTAMAALESEKRSEQPAMQKLCKEAWPIAMLAPGAAAVLDRPVKPRPKIPPDKAGEALYAFVEAERREQCIRTGLAARLQRVITQGGRIDWPVRVSWRCSCCNAENFHPPSQQLLATPCRECGAKLPWRKHHDSTSHYCKNTNQTRQPNVRPMHRRNRENR